MNEATKLLINRNFDNLKPSLETIIMVVPTGPIREKLIEANILIHVAEQEIQKL